MKIFIEEENEMAGNDLGDDNSSLIVLTKLKCYKLR